MSPKLVYTAAAVAAALSLAVMPADAQDRRGGRRERARADQAGGGSGGGERQDGGRRAVPRTSASRQESPARQAPRYEESRQAAAPQQAPQFSQRRRDQAAQDGSRSNQARANSGSRYSNGGNQAQGARRRCLAARATATRVNAPRHAVRQLRQVPVAGATLRRSARIRAARRRLWTRRLSGLCQASALPAVQAVLLLAAVLRVPPAPSHRVRRVARRAGAVSVGVLRHLQAAGLRVLRSGGLRRRGAWRAAIRRR